ncbi:hypothetical protein LCDVSa168L [Lymphocystis disease virus 3]|uniref:Uncharacterized protein n=1 Tax=Lymphocystis disease virus 3 TaxID=2560566 RepID=A0A1B2RW71_9VIRU|nr:hypothetical protein BZK12_gp168 [Lymphocystis disease virus Sa]AOC55252.1 hypothetical protein LCDVSa168L [Lymphocystis disease virus 3]
MVAKENLTDLCFIKTVLPSVLKILIDVFKYNHKSVNQGYVNRLKNVILNLYLEKCVPTVESDLSLVTCVGSPIEVLNYTQDVLHRKIRDGTESLDWTC